MHSAVLVHDCPPSTERRVDVEGSSSKRHGSADRDDFSVRELVGLLLMCVNFRSGIKFGTVHVDESVEPVTLFHLRS